MAKRIFSAITSLDGYIEDVDGNFDWGAPDEEVHSFVNDLERPVGTYLYGRWMYETMVYGETVQALAVEPPCVRDFAELWQAADKIVYSTSLETVSSAKTRIERTFDPRVIQELKSSQERDIAVGGPNLAAALYSSTTAPPWLTRSIPERRGGATITAEPRAAHHRTAIHTHSARPVGVIRKTREIVPG